VTSDVCDVRHNYEKCGALFHPLESQVAQGGTPQESRKAGHDIDRTRPPELARDSVHLQNGRVLLLAWVGMKKPPSGVVLESPLRGGSSRTVQFASSRPAAKPVIRSGLGTERQLCAVKLK